MYALGIILMLANIGITLGSTAIIMNNRPLFDMSSTDQLNGLYNGKLGSDRTTMLIIYLAFSLLEIAIRVFSGLLANKLYYKHCTKKINAIKAANNGGDINKTLEEKGGINLPMAISFFASYTIISMLCRVFYSVNI